jgi:hypothetical protein
VYFRLAGAGQRQYFQRWRKRLRLDRGTGCRKLQDFPQYLAHGFPVCGIDAQRDAGTLLFAWFARLIALGGSTQGSKHDGALLAEAEAAAGLHMEFSLKRFFQEHLAHAGDKIARSAVGAAGALARAVFLANANKHSSFRCRGRVMRSRCS